METKGALSRYFEFVLNGVHAIGMTQNDVEVVGSYDRLKQHLHVNAALQVMTEEGINDYFVARARVTAIVEEWLTYASG